MVEWARLQALLLLQGDLYHMVHAVCITRCICMHLLHAMEPYSSSGSTCMPLSAALQKSLALTSAAGRSVR